MSLYDHLPVVHDTGEILQDDRTNWAEEKLRSISVSNVMRIDHRAQRIYECSNELVFVQAATGDKRLISAIFCKDRMCPSCQRRRSLKFFHQVKEVCTELLNREPSARFLLLTLTVPNVHKSELKNTLKHMTKSFDRLFKRAPVKKSITGFFRSLEVTKGKCGNKDFYHPHFHILLSVKASYFSHGFIPQDEWLALWQSCTRQPEITQVDIRRIRPNKKGIRSGEHSLNSDGGSSLASVAGAAAEVGKYATKPSDYINQYSDGTFTANREVVNVLADALHNVKLARFGGILKVIAGELLLDDIELDTADLIHVTDETDVIDAVMRQVFKWNFAHGFYIN